MHSNPFNAPTQSRESTTAALPKFLHTTLAIGTIVFGLSCGVFTSISTVMMFRLGQDTVVTEGWTITLVDQITVVAITLAMLLAVPAGVVARHLHRGNSRSDCHRPEGSQYRST